MTGAGSPAEVERRVMANDRKLIFDLGMHLAADTGFYLRKGFRVVAVEASPVMVKLGEKKLAAHVEAGRLTILHRALWSSDDDEISFYLNPEKTDWSSAYKWWAEKGGHSVTEVRVSTITLTSLFEQYGVPHYIKCDIEGADDLFVRQLLRESRRPAFVSVEAISLEILAVLYAAGYDRVQIVNQAFNAYVKPPEPALEGEFAGVQFNGHMSGLFGREQPPDKWLKLSEAARHYLDFVSMKARNETLAIGWLDFHVTTAATLASSS
jgi:FkbM family methyltransferase